MQQLTIVVLVTLICYKNPLIFLNAKYSFIINIIVIVICSGETGGSMFLTGYLHLNT